MFVINCLPFSKGLKRESLSYFSPEYVEPGCIIEVTVRNKKVKALALESKDAREAKTEIKSADFKLNKVSSLIAKPFLKKEFLDAAAETAEYFASSVGAVLAGLLPSLILENPNLLRTKKNEKIQNENDIQKKANICAMQSEEEDRFANYRSLVREEFAKKKSVIFCLPQNEDILESKEKLERGIESYVCVFYSGMSKSEFKKEWEKAQSRDHPVLIIGSTRWLFAEREDIGTIVMEKENGSGWKTLSRPYFDLRYFAEKFAEKLGVRIIFGDSFLRIETLSRYKEGAISRFESMKWRLPTETPTEIIDLRETIKKEKEFRAVSNELISALKESCDRGSHAFVFVARKGLASITICQDCGTEVRCLNCASPMILYKKKGDGDEMSGVFRCHQCGETRDAAEYCKNCGSWKLGSFGSGADRVALEIRERLPEAKLYELNSETASSGNRASRIVNNFYEQKGSVIIGTEMAFSYLRKKINLTAIGSFDSLFSVPDFRIKEKIFRVIMETKNLAKRNFLIQTRNPEDTAVNLAVGGNLEAFYTSEIEERRMLDYPPFGIFIKITARGTKNFVEKENENLKKMLAKTEAAIFPSMHEKRGEQAAVNAVIKLPRLDWPDHKLLSLLRSLPPHFEIKVDPDSLL